MAMGRIIPLRRSQHDEVQRLLPWRAAGTLDEADTRLVETHLAGCPKCQADLAIERRLASEVAALPFEAEEAWSRLSARMNPQRRGMDFGAWFDAARRRFARSPPWLGWALAAQALVLVGFTLVTAALPAGAAYRTLGSAAAPPAGNVLVIFDPDTPERRLRAALTEVGARMVDGPTEADAYVLQVAPARRDQALRALRQRADVVMAQPLGEGDGRR
jgi:hypothetical protein